MMTLLGRINAWQLPRLVGLLYLCFIPVATSLELDSESIDRWADDYFAPAVAERRLSGAVFGVVQRGKVLSLKAYGWQDELQGIPMDAERSVLRMCSISKSVTAVSVLQLIERGDIAGLDAPVNDYLKRYRLPSPAGDRVTFRQLMTHSSGMTGGGTPQGAHTDMPAPVDAKEMARLLRENLVRPTGELSLYANLGVALEGAAIEDVSGLGLADYTRANIFEPLGMRNALLHHSLATPEDLVVPSAYFPNGEIQPVAFYPKHPAAAASGGLLATASDMLRYADFHANFDKPEYEAVLPRAFRQSMQAVQYRQHPAVDGIGLHLYTAEYGDYDAAMHGCGLPGFAGHLAVIPELGLGVYFTLVRSSAVPALGDLIDSLFGTGRLIAPQDTAPTESVGSTREVWADFAEAFLPPRVYPALETAGAASDNNQSLPTEELAGTYWHERRSFTQARTALSTGNVKRVNALDASRIRIDDLEYLAIGDGVFERVEEPSYRAVFQQLSDGSVFISSYGNSGSSAWRKMGTLNSPVLLSSLLVISLLVLLSGLLAPLWRAPATAGPVRRFGFGAGSAVVVMLMPVVVGSATLAEALIQFFNNDYTRVTIILLAMNAALLLALVLLWRVLGWLRCRAEVSGIRQYVSLAHACLIGLAAIALLYAMLGLNLVGLNL